MKKLLALAVFVTAPSAFAGENTPDTCNTFVGSYNASALCSQMAEYFPFEENSDAHRFGAGMSVLLEPDGVNIARATGKISGGTPSETYGVDLESSTSDRLWQYGGLGSAPYSVAVWFKPESLPSVVGNKMTLLSSNTTNIPGPELYLETTNATGPKAKVCYVNTEVETGVAITPVCSAADSIQAATWYHVVAGESEFFTGKARIFLSFNGGTISTGAVAYYTAGGPGVLDIGVHRNKMVNAVIFSQYYDGVLDQLIFFGTALKQGDINLLYNSGSGRTYPFLTE